MIRIPVSANQLKKITEEYNRCKEEGRPFEISFTEPVVSKHFGLTAMYGCTSLWEAKLKFRHKHDPLRNDVVMREFFIVDSNQVDYAEHYKRYKKTARECAKIHDLKLVKVKLKPIINRIESFNLSPIVVDGDQLFGSDDWRGFGIDLTIPVEEDHVSFTNDYKKKEDE